MGNRAERGAFFLLQMREGAVGAFCLVAEKQKLRGVLMRIKEIAIGSGEQSGESEDCHRNGYGVFFLGIDDA